MPDTKKPLGEDRMKDFGAVMRGLADTALESVFGAEYIRLGDQEARLIRQDFLEASESENLSAREYAKNIGRNNLSAYGDTMIARFNKGW